MSSMRLGPSGVDSIEIPKGLSDSATALTIAAGVAIVRLAAEPGRFDERHEGKAEAPALLADVALRSTPVPVRKHIGYRLERLDVAAAVVVLPEDRDVRADRTMFRRRRSRGSSPSSRAMS